MAHQETRVRIKKLLLLLGMIKMIITSNLRNCKGKCKLLKRKQRDRRKKGRDKKERKERGKKGDRGREKKSKEDRTKKFTILSSLGVTATGTTRKTSGMIS